LDSSTITERTIIQQIVSPCENHRQPELTSFATPDAV